MNIAIVAVGYNRPDSMSRLLKSICMAEFYTDRVDLIISIDKGQKQAEIVKYAESVVWNHGNKVIRAFSERQGLRLHILQCGDLTTEYDAVVILEDDLIVSPYFYSYVKQAVSYYKSDFRIAGISLYKHEFHPGVQRPFQPENNGYDCYMMQFAQSWGQCWTKEMWAEFREWYNNNEDKDLSEGKILPDYVAGWNQHSWMKYYMRYICENDKYFVYPHVSLTSNGSDVGQHSKVLINDYQIPLLQGDLDYRFPKFEHAVKYDVYFERIGFEEVLQSRYHGIVLLDLNGNRNNFEGADYALSVRNLPYKIVECYGLVHRPIEENVLYPEKGKGIYLYDLKSPETNKIDGNLLTRYDVKGINWKRLLSLGMQGLKEALLRRVQR